MQKANGILPGSSNEKKVTIGKEKNYYNLLDYITNVYDNINKEDSTAKEFKSLYFECIYVGYDTGSTPKVIEMRFSEIKQVN